MMRSSASIASSATLFTIFDNAARGARGRRPLRRDELQRQPANAGVWHPDGSRGGRGSHPQARDAAGAVQLTIGLTLGVGGAVLLLGVAGRQAPAELPLQG